MPANLPSDLPIALSEQLYMHRCLRWRWQPWWEQWWEVCWLEGLLVGGLLIGGLLVGDLEGWRVRGLVVCGLEVCGLEVCGLEVCGLEACGLEGKYGGLEGWRVGIYSLHSLFPLAFIYSVPCCVLTYFTSARVRVLYQPDQFEYITVFSEFW